MTTATHLATRVGDLLMKPFGDHAGWALAFAAVVFAVVALLLFKWATPQRRLAAARDRLIGRLYEAALYQTSLPVILRVQGGVLVANLRYLAMALPAVAVLVVPLVLVVPQLESRLGRQPLAVGEAALVTAALAPGASAASGEQTLAAGEGLLVEAGPVRDTARGELVWRVRAVAPGRHELRLTGPQSTLTLPVPVAEHGLPALVAARHASAFDQVLFDPAGERLPAAAELSRLAIRYPAREVSVLGVAWPWLVSFSVLSLAAGLLLKSRLRVEL